MHDEMKSDMNLESQIHKLLLKYYKTPQFLDKLGLSEYVRDSESLEEQKLGIDVIFKDLSGKEMFVDEKAKIKYAVTDPKRKTGTFAFELTQLGEGRTTKTGWFLQNNKTTHYLLIDIILKDGADSRKYGTDNIKALDNIFISKKDIFAMLESKFSITKDILKERVIEFGDIFQTTMETSKFDLLLRPLIDKSQAYFVFSKTKGKENPLNLILRTVLFKDIAKSIRITL